MAVDQSRSQPVHTDLAGVRLWKASLQWRRAAERALGPLGLSFKQWLVLDAAIALLQERRDAISQRDLSRSTGVDESSLSAIMRGLVERSLVDRGIDITGLVYRIYLTDAGERVAREGRARVAAVPVDGGALGG